MDQTVDDGLGDLGLCARLDSPSLILPQVKNEPKDPSTKELPHRSLGTGGFLMPPSSDLDLSFTMEDLNFPPSSGSSSRRGSDSIIRPTTHPYQTIRPTPPPNLHLQLTPL